jgi:hypothetical protein
MQSVPKGREPEDRAGDVDAVSEPRTAVFWRLRAIARAAVSGAP